MMGSSIYYAWDVHYWVCNGNLFSKNLSKSSSILRKWGADTISKSICTKIMIFLLVWVSIETYLFKWQNQPWKIIRWAQMEKVLRSMHIRIFYLIFGAWDVLRTWIVQLNSGYGWFESDSYMMFWFKQKIVALNLTKNIWSCIIEI